MPVGRQTVLLKNEEYVYEETVTVMITENTTATLDKIGWKK
jgi:hypothetical protein